MKEKKSTREVFREKILKILGRREEKDPWAKNLFSDLGRLKGRLIVMRMG